MNKHQEKLRDEFIRSVALEIGHVGMRDVYLAYSTAMEQIKPLVETLEKISTHEFDTGTGLELTVDAELAVAALAKFKGYK